MKMFFTKIHYNKRLTFFERIVRFILSFFTPFYFFVSEVRNLLYKIKILPSYKIDNAYVISVGNLTTGGVGKTPIVAELANYLSCNKKVCILSRGYKSKLKSKNINVLSEYGKITYKASLGGDEPVWLCENCPASSVLVSSNRVKIAKYAVNKLKSEVLILDDGFQHQKLRRDLNILVVDSQKAFGNKSILPKGPLRELMCNIKRADKIILVNKNFDNRLVNKYKIKLELTYKKPVYICNMVADYIYNIKTQEKLTEYKTVCAFSAIGQPEQFYKYLYDKLDVRKTIDYPDHYTYTQKDIEDLKEKALKNLTSILVTTEKDAVKLLKLNLENVEIYALKLRADLDVEGVLDVEKN